MHFSTQSEKGTVRYGFFHDVRFLSSSALTLQPIHESLTVLVMQIFIPTPKIMMSLGRKRSTKYDKVSTKT